MYKTLFSTQKGTWHTMRNTNVLNNSSYCFEQFPVAQLVEHGVSNAKIMGSIPRESKSW